MDLSLGMTINILSTKGGRGQIPIRRNLNLPPLSFKINKTDLNPQLDPHASTKEVIVSLIRNVMQGGSLLSDKICLKNFTTGW